jgi:hypothetical protein
MIKSGHEVVKNRTRMPQKNRKEVIKEKKKKKK